MSDLWSKHFSAIDRLRQLSRRSHHQPRPEASDEAAQGAERVRGYRASAACEDGQLELDAPPTRTWYDSTPRSGSWGAVHLRRRRNVRCLFCPMCEGSLAPRRKGENWQAADLRYAEREWVRRRSPTLARSTQCGALAARRSSPAARRVHRNASQSRAMTG